MRLVAVRRGLAARRRDLGPARVARRRSGDSAAVPHLRRLPGALGRASRRRAPALRGAQSGRVVASATRGLDPDHVAGVELARDLPGKLRTVERVPAGLAGRAPVASMRRVPPPLADDRQTARLEYPQLAHDAVTATVPAGATGAEPERVALDAERVRELERLGRSRECVRHGDVYGRRSVRIGASALAAADRLVVG